MWGSFFEETMVLGHTDDQITKNVYLHVTKEIKKKSLSKVR